MTYLDPLADLIRSCLPHGAEPPAHSDDLFRIYAVLLLAKGDQVTDEDVHNAWSAWTQSMDSSHEALIAFHKLDPKIRAFDAPYAEAIRTAARRLGHATD
ncbi:DUF7701 domain-containing protein [Streptomyces albidoflavus]|uniref:DUF7701 domain-containing protein n=1 Tax=Streptomyces albidoflavus TaxID=1886 RepID=A0AA37BZA4_9ACTN|nr:hypothetical protein [Streptomyces albidoflavus]RZE47593.1 hypothetical protein C0Q97_31070 [Streptomyces albidoflavus]WQG72984.1 hypothetical protein SR864_18330 [Streptomyces albidoflavus]GHI47576.1 hypothetical protein ScoT_37500 [Streptomyces albidoflavus]